MKHILIAIIVFIFCNSCESTHSQIEISGYTMGTTYNIKIISNNKDEEYKVELKEQIDSIFISINNQMSTYLFNSEISTFNNKESTLPFQISDEFS